MIALLIEFIYMLKIHKMQNNNILLKKSENNGPKNLKDPKTFIEFQIICIMFFKNIEE